VFAKTRSWEQSEKFAQAERDRRDPVKQRLREIEEQEIHKTTLQQTQDITIDEATERWVASQRPETIGTARIYKRASGRIREWATDRGINRVSEMTANELDLWRGTWSASAEKEYSRMGQTTQSHFQGRLQKFCRWCVDTGKFAKNPAVFLKHIPFNNEETQPLTPVQFNELLASIEIYVAVAKGQFREFAKELKALFLLQRYTGLRIQDALMLPRTGVQGNLMTLTTRKTKTLIDGRPLPACVVEALQDLSPDRPLFRADYFFWN
jgi:hypothetical protein